MPMPYDPDFVLHEFVRIKPDARNAFRGEAGCVVEIHTVDEEYVYDVSVMPTGPGQAIFITQVQEHDLAELFSSGRGF